MSINYWQPGPGHQVPNFEAWDRVIVAFSGGKDSLACVLRLLEMGCPRNKIELWHHDVDGGPDAPHFMDWPVTRAYCKAVAAALELPILFSWKEGGFEREMLREGTPTAPITFEAPHAVGVVRRTVGGKGPAGTRLKFPQVSADLSVRWCSAYLKIDVGARVFANDPRFSDGHFLFVTGERRQESAARAKYKEIEPHKSATRRRRVVQWRAVIDFTEDDVWQLIERHGVRPHPAYELGFGRVSCAACIFGNADQWASVHWLFPEAFKKIADYEKCFGKTIQRKRSVRDLASMGQPLFDPATAALSGLVQLGRSREYAERVRLSNTVWRRPAGAGRSCGGPT
jgi:3'-phosphoadenosine 5'-phosphosulfate sulfotransferase (PAPS reductase)/FAD synthetase